MMSSILQQISYHTVPRQRMAAIQQVFAIFAVCLVFCPILASLTPSSELLSKNEQHFGFSFPKLGNISFANVSKQCRETVEKLSKTDLAYPCEYLSFFSVVIGVMISSCVNTMLPHSYAAFSRS